MGNSNNTSTYNLYCIHLEETLVWRGFQYRRNVAASLLLICAMVPELENNIPKPVCRGGQHGLYLFLVFMSACGLTDLISQMFTPYNIFIMFLEKRMNGSQSLLVYLYYFFYCFVVI